LGLAAGLQAQEKIAIEQEDYANQQIEMADQFRADGKIWVVMVVAGLIFVGFIGYTVSIDRRLGKLEKELPESKPGQPA
jgi:hypothetical protein